MQKKEFIVCDMSLFESDTTHFWMDDLENLSDKFPVMSLAHYQNFYTLLMVWEGSGEICINNHKIPVKNDQVIILKPTQVNHITIDRHAKGRIINFTEDFFSLRYNNHVLYHFSFFRNTAISAVKLPEDQKSRWDTLLHLIFEEYTANKHEKKMVLRSYLNILLFSLQRLCNPGEPYKLKSSQEEKIHRFHLLINKHFMEEKSPTFYAEIMCISPNYLNKLCKTNTGKTAGELIRKRVIIEAQRLLHASNLTINEIAHKIGFENPSYFTTFFKKQTQLTPDQYRRKNIE